MSKISKISKMNNNKAKQTKNNVNQDKFNITKSVLTSYINDSYVYVYNCDNQHLLAKISKLEDLVSLLTRINKSKPSYSSIYWALKCDAGYGLVKDVYISFKEVIKFNSVQDELDRFNNYLATNLSGLKLKLYRVLRTQGNEHNYNEDIVQDVLSYMTRQIVNNQRVTNNYESTFIDKYKFEILEYTSKDRLMYKKNKLIKTEASLAASLSNEQYSEFTYLSLSKDISYEEEYFKDEYNDDNEETYADEMIALVNEFKASLSAKDKKSYDTKVNSMLATFNKEKPTVEIITDYDEYFNSL